MPSRRNTSASFLPSLQRLARPVLAGHLLERAAHDVLLRLARDDDHAVDVAEHEVPAAHGDAGGHITARRARP
jgi:hypothetical protein